jgi:ABC-type glutathione transport system ATPase component
LSVAIARAILKKPAIMVFDEATSSLDTHTEAEIQAAIHSVAAGRTTITVAHRLSTIMHSHQIIVLDKGIIAEQGTHDELLSRPNGLYAKMWARQQKTLELQADLTQLAQEEAAHAATQKAAPSASPAPAVADSVSIQIVGDSHAPRRHAPSTVGGPAPSSSDSYSAALASVSVNATRVPSNARAPRGDVSEGDSSHLLQPATATAGDVESGSAAAEVPSLRQVRAGMSAAVVRARQQQQRAVADAALAEPLLPEQQEEEDLEDDDESKSGTN